MDVRTLITELLEFNLDLDVEIAIENEEISDFDLVEVGYNTKWVHFKIEAKGMTLVDDRDLNELQERADSVDDLNIRIKELEDEVNLLEIKLEQHE